MGTRFVEALPQVMQAVGRIGHPMEQQNHRAGVIRPEIIIPKLDREKPGEAEKDEASGGLSDGTRVRIIREPNFGSIATVTGLPPELHAMECETKVRVLKVKLDSGEEYLLPRANVELIEH